MGSVHARVVFSPVTLCWKDMHIFGTVHDELF